jgi:hypothetical protein
MTVKVTSTVMRSDGTGFVLAAVAAVVAMVVALVVAVNRARHTKRDTTTTAAAGLWQRGTRQRRERGGGLTFVPARGRAVEGEHARGDAARDRTEKRRVVDCECEWVCVQHVDQAACCGGGEARKEVSARALGSGCGGVGVVWSEAGPAEQGARRRKWRGSDGDSARRRSAVKIPIAHAQARTARE